MAYLILAHEDEAQLDVLVEALLPSGTPDIAIIHADRGSRLWPVLRARPDDPAGRIRVIRDPVAVRWGHWSQVAAISRLVEAAVEEGCDMAHLISGSDWPVTGRDEIVSAISRESQPPCFIEAVPDLLKERMQTYRLDSRWLRVDPGQNPSSYAATWQLRRLSRWGDALRTKLGFQRSHPFGPWRKGSTWWSLPQEALACLASELPRLLKSGRLHGTVCSDEHAVPTIIAAHFPDRLSGNRRFILWPEDASSPRLLERADIAAIVQSGAWFARKVSRAHDPFFLELPEAVRYKSANSAMPA